MDQDWRDRYGHGLLLAETFVEPECYAGTCYKASNWIELGLTRGFEQKSVDYYESHGTPKRLFLRPMRKHARSLLCAEALPDEWKKTERD